MSCNGPAGDEEVKSLLTLVENTRALHGLWRLQRGVMSILCNDKKCIMEARHQGRRVGQVVMNR